MRELNHKNLTEDVRLVNSGVYKIYLYSSNGPITINRFLGGDNSGLIYVGAAEKSTLKYRLENFSRTMNPINRINNHSGGNKIKINQEIRKFILKGVLIYDVITTASAKLEEKKEIQIYKERFGEVPPLNG
jgi:hypothetical protein